MSVPQGWMGKDDHRGWRGVTDNIHVLLAVTYAPEGGILACHFCTGPDRVHTGVPEKCYRAIVSSPYGGSYYRKYVRDKYPTPYEEKQPKFKEGPLPRKKLKVKEVPDTPPPPQMSLFMLLDKRAARRTNRDPNLAMKEWRKCESD